MTENVTIDIMKKMRQKRVELKMNIFNILY